MFTVTLHFTKIKQEYGRKGIILLRTQLPSSVPLCALKESNAM